MLGGLCHKVALACGVVAWAGASAWGGHFALNPVSASGSYQLVGENEIHLDGGGQVVVVHLELSDWAPHVLRGWQARVRAADYASGAGSPLAPNVLGCAAHADCLAAYGSGTACDNNVCRAGFINRLDPTFVFANAVSCGLTFIDVGLESAAGYLYFGVIDSDCAVPDSIDDGTVKYGGTLILHVPPDARGNYEVGFVDGVEETTETFMLDETNDFHPKHTYGSARIVVLCNQDIDCEDSNDCTVESCGEDRVCGYTPLEENSCDDEVFCTVVDACAAGVCVGEGDPCKPSEWCHEAQAQCELVGDANGDDAIDLTDFAMLRQCLLGPNVFAIGTVCAARLDMDGNQVIDLRDVAAFQNLFGQP